jgi:hypothetical protein
MLSTFSNSFYMIVKKGVYYRLKSIFVIVLWGHRAGCGVASEHFSIENWI